MIYYLKTDLKSPLYQAVVDLGTQRRCSVLMVVRDSIPLSQGASAVLRELEPFLIEKKEASQWPGTILTTSVALVFRYLLCTLSASVLKNATDHLYGWAQPDLPEDLCLVGEAGAPFLTTISHEEESYFHLSAKEREDLVRAIPEIDSMLSAGVEPRNHTS
jgi:hypothetical protein